MYQKHVSVKNAKTENGDYVYEAWSHSCFLKRQRKLCVLKVNCNCTVPISTKKESELMCEQTHSYITASIARKMLDASYKTILLL